MSNILNNIAEEFSKRYYTDGDGVKREDAEQPTGYKVVKFLFGDPDKKMNAGTPLVGGIASGVKTAGNAAKAANAFEELQRSGVKIDEALLKEMANGSWTGKTGTLTKAAKEARAAYAEAINKFSMSSKEAWNAAMSRFKYILEKTPASELGSAAERTKELPNVINTAEKTAQNISKPRSYVEAAADPEISTNPNWGWYHNKLGWTLKEENGGLIPLKQVNR